MSKPHVIGKQFFSVAYNGKRGEALAVQRELSALYREKIMKQLDTLFDKYADENNYVLINKLEIDLGEFQRDQIDLQFGDRLITNLEAMIRQKVNAHFEPELESEIEIIPSQEQHQNHFKYFLLHGHFPWRAKSYSLELLEKEIVSLIKERPKAREEVRIFLRSFPVAQKRLIAQFRSDFLGELLKKVPSKPGFEPSVLVKMWVIMARRELSATVAGRVYEKHFWQSWLKVWVEETKPAALYQEVKWLAPLIQTTAKATGIKREEVVRIIVKEEKTIELLPAVWRKPLAIGLATIEQAFPNTSDEFIAKPVQDLSEDKLKVEKPKEVGLPRETNELEEKHISKENSVKGEPLEEGSKEGIQRESEEISPITKKPKGKAQIELSSLDLEEGLYVVHAGIVILHPFLPTLFEELGLVKDKSFVDEEAQVRALHLLVYLASGNTEVAESEMLLHKFICELPLEEPVERFIELSAKEKEECDHFLKTVIDHWKVLKKTSIDGLRVNFMQRDGKLSKKESGWRLRVEQQVYDMTLNHLPWGIGIVKLPWKTELLHVEWV